MLNLVIAEAVNTTLGNLIAVTGAFVILMALLKNSRGVPSKTF